MRAEKGKETLEESFKHAEEALLKLDTSPSDDPKHVNLATSLIHDLEKKVMRLTCPDERDKCRTRLEDLQQRLHDASGESNTPEPSPAATHPGEVVGDIDDLFSGMNIDDAGDSTKQEFVPQGIPGRRYMKIVRPSNGGKGVAVPAVPSPAAAAAAPRPHLPHDAQDIAGQGPEKEAAAAAAAAAANVDSDDENARYKPQRNIPSSPLRVLLPDMPLAEAAGAASHGSADSTMARGGGGDRNGDADSDSDDDSITSPDNYNEAASFRS